MGNYVELKIGEAPLGEGKLSRKEEIFYGGAAILAIFVVYLILSKAYGGKK